MIEKISLTPEVIRAALEAPVARITISADNPLLVEKQIWAKEVTKEVMISPHGKVNSANSSCKSEQTPRDIHFVITTASFRSDRDRTLGKPNELVGMIACTAPCCNKRFFFHTDIKAWLPSSS